MELKYYLLNIRNSVDFYLRSHFKWSRALKPNFPTPERDLQLQKEFSEFLYLLPWEKILSPLGKSVVVADIGARNFVFAPIMDKLFFELGIQADLNGIEIDAYRLLADFRSRKDYGEYYARQARNGHFHPIDFLKWNRPLDLAFLLNPFVSEEPTIDWGLPLSTLNPARLFSHVFGLLRPKAGKLVLSCPSPEELEIAVKLAVEVGFRKDLESVWKPKLANTQKKPRYGVVFHSTLGR